MKILHIIDNLYPGGAERVMVNLCNWLHAEGVQIEVALIVGKGTELLNQLNPAIPVHFISRYNKFDINPAKNLANLLSRFELAHIHMRHNYRYTRLVSSIFSCKTPLILHDHSSSVRKFTGLGDCLRPRYFIGTSEFSEKYAREKLNMPNSIFKLENVIEKEIYDIKHPPQSAFVLVSNIKPEKNQHFALRLLKNFDQKLHLYGAIQDQSYYSKLQLLISKDDIVERVVFKTDCQNVQRHLGNFQLGLHTSSKETGPLAIIEYLAQGIPFVAYRTGGAAEKISRDFPEFFMDNFEVEEWVDRIRELMSSPPDLEKMAYVFDKYFSKQTYVNKCLKIYKSILQS